MSTNGRPNIGGGRPTGLSPRVTESLHPEASRQSAPAPSVSQPSAPPRASSSHTHSQEVNALFEKRNVLQQRRHHLGGQLEQVKRNLDSCISQAKSLGINSIEELRSLIAEAKEKDMESMAKFTEELENESKLQTETIERVQQIERESLNQG